MIDKIKKMVRQSRKEQRERFGDVEIKEDCAHHKFVNCEDYCECCCNYYGKGREHGGLQCGHGVCYFYAKKGDV